MLGTRRRWQLLVVVAGLLFALWLVNLWAREAPSSPDPARVVQPDPPGPADPMRSGEADGRLLTDVPRPRSGPVECEITESVGYYDVVTIDEVDADTLEVIAQHRPVTLADNWIRFQPVSDEGLGWIRSRRHEPATLAWVQGACIDLVEMKPIPVRQVTGIVEGQIEVGGVAVHGRCENKSRGGFSGSLGPDGRFRLTLPHHEPCELVVLRVFANRTLESEPTTIPPGTQDVDGIVMVSPEPEGPGMGLYPTDGGLLVHDLQAGSAAEEAGIRKRDILLAIDGESVDGADAEKTQALDGPAVLELERDGAVFEVVLP